MKNILDANGNTTQITDTLGNITTLQYRYLEYDTNGYVVKIYDDEPATLLDASHKIAIADNRNFEEGYEFSNYIVVATVSSDGTLTSGSVVKQPESVNYLRQQLDTANKTINTLQSQNAQMLLSLVNGGLM